MNNKSKVTILMATFNGEKYIDEQIKSILMQEYDNWELIIRDDNSTDNTIEIIKEHCEIDSRIKILSFGEEHGTATKNFAQLLKWGVDNRKEYIMFADQDDIWLSDKITVTLENMILAENTWGAETPLMLYGRFTYVNSCNVEIKKKFRFQQSVNINNLLCDNYVYGCTMMINLALSKKANPIPRTAVNHDYWIAMVASCFGKSFFLNKILLHYRQHSGNASGNISKTLLSNRIMRYFTKKYTMLPLFKANIVMYKDFFSVYHEKLSDSQIKLFKGYFLKLHSSNISLLLFLLKNKIFKADFTRTIIYLYILLRLRGSIIKDGFN